MAHSSNIFEQQPIRVQNVNGFDLSHMVCGTAYAGSLTPVLCKMLPQKSKISLGASMEVNLPPLATSFYGRVDAHLEVFFVPCSILYGGWKQFISNNPSTSFINSSQEPYSLPIIKAEGQGQGLLLTSMETMQASNQSILPYLRYRVIISNGSVFLPGSGISLLPLLAYAKIWDCFFRNPQVTRTIFAVNPGSNAVPFSGISYVHHSFYNRNNTADTGVFVTLPSLTWPDGVPAWGLRQRNYPRDYFTAASPSPQLGNPSQLQFSVDLSTGDGSFSIAALRAANSLQKFAEASNYDPTYRGIMRANFGSSPTDADWDEPTYLGRLVVPVYQKGVYISSPSAGDGNGRNPFINGRLSGSLSGAKAAAGQMNGEGSIIDNFKIGCFGYVFGLFSLVPHAQYSFGIDRMWTDLQPSDFPFPILQSIGMDSIKNYEVYPVAGNNGDFAYIPRYSRFKYIDDWVCGELAPGRTLESFVLQRQFASLPSFGTAFLEIPQNALDSVFSVSSENMKCSCWFEIFWVFKAVMPLSEFCIPTLGELQDTHTINVKQGGSRL